MLIMSYKYDYMKHVYYGRKLIIHEEVEMKDIETVEVRGFSYFMDDIKMKCVDDILSDFTETTITLNRFPQIHLLDYNKIMSINKFIKFIDSFYDQNIFMFTDYIKFQYTCYDHWENPTASGFLKFTKHKQFEGARTEKIKRAIEEHKQW